jgi:membrane fusion protein (multidrug efflux system)
MRGRVKTWMLISLMTFIFPITSAWGESLAAVVDWGQRLELGPLVGGTVITANAEVGNRVEKGSELMQIDPTPYGHRVAAAEARVESTRVDE